MQCGRGRFVFYGSTPIRTKVVLFADVSYPLLVPIPLSYLLTLPLINFSSSLLSEVIFPHMLLSFSSRAPCFYPCAESFVLKNGLKSSVTVFCLVLISMQLILLYL